MTDGNPVQLVNRGGKIVGIDPETGETVPIKMGEGLGTEEEPIPDESHFESLRTESLVNGRTNASLVDEGTIWQSSGMRTVARPDDVSSTEYETVTNSLIGSLTTASLPDGMTFEARFTTRVSPPDGEVMAVKPMVEQFNSSSATFLDELEIESDTSGSTQTLDSGWAEISDISNQTTRGRGLRAKVTGGTGTFSSEWFHALVFRWRVD